jgi:hypothetical protein
MSENNVSPKSLEKYTVRYKITYSTVALILGIILAISGCWLGSLGYQPEVTGWMFNIWGCQILYDENNWAPAFFLFVVGLFLIIITQYRIRTKRKPKGQRDIDGKVLLYKFIYSMTGLTVGVLCTILGILLAEMGGNGCPPDWATKITSDENLFSVGVRFFLAGIIILIATRYRIRIYDSLGENNIKEINN